MKYRQTALACGFVLSLVLCAFALGGCELFAEDPPRLVIRNESPGPVTSVEFWEETPELSEIGVRYAKAFVKQFTDPGNFLIHVAEYITALAEYIVVADKVTQTTPSLIKDDTVIPVGGSRSWDLDADESYIARINGKLAHVSMNRGSIDTVYVFDGENLGER
jgi:hypothetical protein